MTHLRTGPWLRLIKEGKQYEIDDLSNHVIPMTLTYDDLKSKDTHATLAGTTRNLHPRWRHGQRGAREVAMSSRKGPSVIGLDDLAYVPQALR